MTDDETRVPDAPKAQARTPKPRAATARKKTWNPPRKLDAPKPLKGFRQKWVREVMLGKDDPHNAADRLREGWEPRPASTIPPGWPTKNGVLRNGGLILCHMEEELVEQRTAYYARQTSDINESLPQEVRDAEVEGNPIHQVRKTETSKGKVPYVQQD